MSKFDKYSTLFTLGFAEQQEIIHLTENSDNYLIQEQGFSHYCNKLSEMIKNFNKKNETDWNSVSSLDANQPTDIFDFIKCVIVYDFIMYKRINFSLFVCAYHIVNAYTYFNENLFYPQDMLRRTIEYNIIGNIDNFVNFANEYYYDKVPFFWKRCVYGYKVFLDLYLLYNLYPIGTGLDCYQAHGGFITNPYQMMSHDLQHFNQYVINNMENLGKQNVIDWYTRILEIATIERQGSIFLLYYLLHETEISPIKENKSLLHGYKYKLLNVIIGDFRSNRLYTPELWDAFINKWIRDIGFATEETTISYKSLKDLQASEDVTIDYSVFKRDYAYFSRLMQNCTTSVKFINIYNILWDKFIDLYY